MKKMKKFRFLFMLVLIFSLCINGNIYPVASADTTTISEAVYKVIEEFEGTGYISARDPINAGAQFEYASRPAPVVFGNQSGKLSYQFTSGKPGNAAAYMNFWNDRRQTEFLELEGKPSKLGLWVFGDGNNNHWLRAEFNDGKVSELTKSNEFNWIGWKYVVFDVPVELLLDGYTDPIKLRRIYPVQTSDSNKTDGVIYFDRLSAFYGDTGGIYGLDLSGLTPMKIGETRTAQALETRAGYMAPQPATVPVIYASSNSEVATVSSAGQVTAKAAGTTTITAAYGGFTATYELQVGNDTAAVQQLSLTGPNEAALKDTFTVELYATFQGNPAAVRIVDGAVFKSDNTKVASVDSKGTVTALQAGTTTIRATYGGKTAELKITVKEQKKALDRLQIVNLSPVDIGATQTAKVMAKYTNSDQLVEIKQGVKFSSSKPKVATVDSSGRIKGVSVGATVITATFEGKTAVYTMVVNKAGLKPQKRELRAAWIATVDRIDWPKSTNREQQKQEYIDILNMHQSIGMNAVVMQIKPTADAFYPSQYAPWSHWLTGKQGQNPGYDPLAFMIEETHKRNMEFHAWFNPYRISTTNDWSSLSADHPARKHPDWVMEYKGKLYFDPGNPEVIDYITKTVMEVVEKYDIDAVHFDDYFYPNQFDGPNYPDQATYEKYGKRNYPNNINAWRRNNVDTLIKTVSTKIKEKKNYVKFGISPFGVWRNKSVDPNGSNTAAGQPSYDNLHADVRKWVTNSWIDYVAPQIYWNFGFEPAAYEELVKWWSDLIRTSNAKTQLYIGHADYKAFENENFTDPYEIANQLKFNLNYSDVKGSIHFTTRDLINKPQLRQMIKDAYRYPALVPTMSWLGGKASEKAGVSSMSAMQQAFKAKISWTDTDTASTYFVIYRTQGNQAIDINNPAHILTTVRKKSNQMAYVDEQTVVGETYNYAVTAVNRLHVESKLSNTSTVKVLANPGAEVSSTIPSGKSGLLSLENEVTVSVPTGALSKEFTLKIAKVLDWSNIRFNNRKLVSQIYDITKNVSGSFKKSVQIKMAYNTAQLNSNEYPAMFYYDESKRDWVNIGGIASGGYITADTTHFTKFAVFAVERPVVTPDPCSAVAFTDTVTHWAKDQIRQAVVKCIVTGYSDQTFRPEKPITREEFAVMLVRALSLDSKGKQLTFKDNSKISNWAYAEVKTAVNAGIITGYADGTFRPQDRINRAEVTAMAVRALQLEHKPVVRTSFADDASIPAWAKEYVKAASDKKIVEGRSGNNFAPLAQTTRAEAAVIMLRILDKK